MQKQKYKMVCLDLDGTLLDSNHRISKNAIKVLRFLESKGVIIAIVTGRNDHDGRSHGGQISQDTYYIASNGAIVGQVREAKELFKTPLSKERMEELLDLSKEVKVKPIVFSPGKTWVLGLRHFLMHILFVLKSKSKKLRHITLVLRRQSLHKHLKENKEVLKMVFFVFDQKRRREIESHLRHQSAYELAVTSNVCFEITEKGMNKSAGIRQLIDHLGIQADEVVAFGDSENDLAMLDFAGLGVAMGNAIDKVKAVADTQTQTNDQDGVYLKLKELIKNKQF